MQRLILTIDNFDNAQKLLQFIEQFNFIETIEIINPIKTYKKKKKEAKVKEFKNQIPESKFKSWEEFESLCGIWSGRDITKESLRKIGWRVC